MTQIRALLWIEGLLFRGGVPMLTMKALWHAPFGIRLRPKLPANAEGDELSRIFRRYSVSVPSVRDPEYAAALDEAPSLHVTVPLTHAFRPIELIGELLEAAGGLRAP